MTKLDHLQAQAGLAPYTTMKVGGPADYLVAVRSPEEVQAACELAADRDIPIFVLGEGSNIVVSDAPVHRLVLKMEVAGREVLAEDGRSATVRVGAGEHWDDVVAWTVEQGWSGIEAMSMIPGTAGAAPVQNAGAYGQEIADTLVEVDAYDLQERRFVTLRHDDCGFGYRTSRFKAADAERFVILNVTLKLSKRPPAAPKYASLKRYLEERRLNHPTVREIRAAVMEIRARILPDPSVVPNTGSFFKNPVVNAAEAARLREEHPDVPVFDHGELFKVSAGWLLEQCGFKGREEFGLKIWPHHALVITNPDGAGYADVRKMMELMVATVRDKFGVTLEPEPQFIT